MKKIFWTGTALCVTAMLATGALTACGGSEEERFSKAKESFTNYTVAVDISYDDGDEYHSELLIADKAGKLTVTSEGTTIVRYFKEENSTVFSYADKSSGWRNTDESTIEEATENYNGYVALFQSVFYDDFEKDGDYLKMKESVLPSYSKKLSPYITLSSAKLTLKSNRFTTAIAVAEMGNTRCEMNYTFKDYGKTSVTLPEA